MGRYLQGLPGLLRKLERLKTEIAPAIKPAMAAVADRIVADMRAVVPVHHGDLRKSIGWSFGEAPEGAQVVAVIGSGAIRGRKEFHAGALSITFFAGDAKAFYARWVEFGTKAHLQGGYFKGGTSPGTQAQPFFYPTFRANKKRALSEIRKAIEVAIREAIK